MPEDADKTWEGGSWAVCQWHLHASTSQLWQEVWRSANKRCSAATHKHIFCQMYFFSYDYLPPTSEARTANSHPEMSHRASWGMNETATSAAIWIYPTPLCFIRQAKWQKSLPFRTYGLCHSPYWPFRKQEQESIDLFKCLWHTRERWTNCGSPSNIEKQTKKTKELFASKLIHGKCDKSATNVTCFVGVTKVCVGKKKQLKHFKQGPPDPHPRKKHHLWKTITLKQPGLLDLCEASSLSLNLP